jgi:hypothetical protein
MRVKIEVLSRERLGIKQRYPIFELYLAFSASIIYVPLYYGSRILRI